MNREKLEANVGGFKRVAPVKTPIGEIHVRSLTEFEILEYGGELGKADRARTANLICSLACIDDATGDPLFDRPSLGDAGEGGQFDPLLRSIPFGYRLAMFNTALALSGLAPDTEGVGLLEEIETAKN